ncbi:MAG: hypothetical protein JO190_12270 [Candidatus Eremiobacteraeota bacterium]|nr:hypothetical protein [Candidatus Eremiobacteraeota bacterium]MBV8498594.1 hypothetical protein [Candidatus Eremiobacteraeota bacterium]
MPVGFRTLLSLVLCAAAAGAALAHVAIDVVGDYALARDSYDHVAHGSRELLSSAALILAVILAGRGLRACCEIASANRWRLLVSALRLPKALAFVAAAVAGSVALVPAMEWLDGRLAGAPVRALDDAFGGSLLLGLATTVVCAVAVALMIYAVVCWLISHRDSIATIIVTLLRRVVEPVRGSSYSVTSRGFTPRRRRAPNALRLCKRGPPRLLFA